MLKHENKCHMLNVGTSTQVQHVHRWNINTSAAMLGAET